MRTTQAAAECKVTLNTIRNWTKDYGQFLSPSANVTTGVREFTGRDIEILKYIALLRSERMQKDAIMQRLGETTFAEIEQPTDIAPIAHPDAQEGQVQAPGAIVAPDYLLMLERRFEALERSGKEAQAHVIYYIALGIGIGLGLAAVAELFALLASRIR